MTQPKLGGNNYKAALNNIHDETAFCSTILDRLLEPNITSIDKNRLIAQASLALGRIGHAARELEAIGKDGARPSEKRKPPPKTGRGSHQGKDTTGISGVLPPLYHKTGEKST